MEESERIKTSVYMSADLHQRVKFAAAKLRIKENSFMESAIDLAVLAHEGHAEAQHAELASACMDFLMNAPEDDRRQTLDAIASLRKSKGFPLPSALSARKRVKG